MFSFIVRLISVRSQCEEPFLAPLKPLTLEAARQTFFDIAEDIHDSNEVDRLLSFTDNMPLAIDLMAHLVDYEGCSKVLSRWEVERTSLLSEVYDKRSNLDQSILLSLSSPRITSSPDAQDLLSLLAILPDGILELELLQSKLPIEILLGCKATLLRTSLATIDVQGRLRTLVPIGEYMQRFHPPPDEYVRSLRKHFQELLEVYNVSAGTPSSPGMVSRIISNFSNIENLLRDGLQPGNPNITDTIYCTIFFERFRQTAGRGRTALMDQVPKVLPSPSDPKLEVCLCIQILSSWDTHSIPDSKALIDQALENLHNSSFTIYI